MQIPTHKRHLLLFADRCEADAFFSLFPFTQSSPHLYHCPQVPIDLCIFHAWGEQGVISTFAQHPCNQYDLWINIGFAGACSPLLPLQHCYTVSQVYQLTPDIPPKLSQAPSLPLHPLPFLPVHTLVSAHTPYTYGFHPTFTLVDMEGYTVASYAQQWQIPCMMIKITSDYTEPSQRSSFHHIKRALSEHLAQTFLKYWETRRKSMSQIHETMTSDRQN